MDQLFVRYVEIHSCPILRPIEERLFIPQQAGKAIYVCPLLFLIIKELHVITMKICHQMEEIHGNINP